MISQALARFFNCPTRKWKVPSKCWPAGVRGETEFTRRSDKRGAGLVPSCNLTGRSRRKLSPPLGSPRLAGAVLPRYCFRLDGNRSHSLGGFGVLKPQDDVVAVGGCHNGGEERAIRRHSQPHLSFDGLGLFWHRPDVRLPPGPPPVSPRNLGPEPSGSAGGTLPRRRIRGPVYRIQQASAAVALGSNNRRSLRTL